MKSEADIIEVTVVEVFREEKSCTGSKSTPCIIFNIVYNLLNNIVLLYLYTFPISN